MQGRIDGPGVWRIDAAGVFDGSGVDAAPGAVLLEVGGSGGAGAGAGVGVGVARVLAAGEPGEVDRHAAAGEARRVDRRGCVLLPGLVNAHTHLDLSSLGPRAFDAGRGFGAWVEMIRRERAREGPAIAASVRLGVEWSLRGGVVAVGDIGGAPGGAPTVIPWRTLRASALHGVSFVEFFAIGRGEAAALERVSGVLEGAVGEWRGTGGMAGRVGGRVGLGVQPHAPYSVSSAAYAWAVEQGGALGLRLATHLAESEAERRFVAQGQGAQRELLERIGLWEDRVLEDVGQGRSAVAHLERVLERAGGAVRGMGRVGGGFVAAHVNDASDEDIATLARTGTSVAYCPRASAYFGAERVFGGHRYREMLEAGVNVALGTDSVVNLEADGPGRPVGERLSTLDEMRLLFRRDGFDARRLVAMATVNGARALGLGEEGFRLAAGGGLVGLVAVAIDDSGSAGDRVLERALFGSSAPELLWIGN